MNLLMLFIFIRQNLQFFLLQYGFEACIFSLIFAATIYLLILYTKKRKSIHSIIVYLLFCFYLYMVYAITLLSRAEGSISHINLQPFSTFSSDMAAQIFITENILMFIPLGIFLSIYGIRRIWQAIGISAVASILIEVLQYFTGRGKAEIDDVITNTFGAVLGYICMFGIKQFFKLVKNKIKRIGRQGRSRGEL